MIASRSCTRSGADRIRHDRHHTLRTRRRAGTRASPSRSSRAAARTPPARSRCTARSPPGASAASRPRSPCRRACSRRSGHAASAAMPSRHASMLPSRIAGLAMWSMTKRCSGNAAHQFERLRQLPLVDEDVVRQTELRERGDPALEVRAQHEAGRLVLHDVADAAQPRVRRQRRSCSATSARAEIDPADDAADERDARRQAQAATPSRRRSAPPARRCSRRSRRASSSGFRSGGRKSRLIAAIESSIHACVCGE